MNRITNLLVLLLVVFSSSSKAQIVLSEGFENTVTPPGWTYQDFSRTTTNPCTGVASLRRNFYGTANATGSVTTPNLVGLSNGEAITISYEWKAIEYSEGDGVGVEMNVEYSINNGDTWISLDTFTVEVITTCETETLTIPAGIVPQGADFKLRFSGVLVPGNDCYFYLDSVQIVQESTLIPGCVSLSYPENNAQDVPVNASIIWPAASDAPLGYLLTVGTTISGTDVLDAFDVGNSLSYTFVDFLDPETTYYVTVTPYNQNGSATGCVTTSFTTGDLAGSTCSDPLIINSLPFETTDDTANYLNLINGSPGTTASCGSSSNYLNGNTVVYAYTADVTSLITITMDPEDTWSGIFVYDDCNDIGQFCIAGVANSGSGVRELTFVANEGETYFILISTWPSPQTVAYTLNMTANTCPEITNLQLESSETDSLALAWDLEFSNPDVTYEWALMLHGADLENGTPIASGVGEVSEIIIDNLASGTNYQFYVRSICSEDVQSGWISINVMTECDVLIAPTAIQIFESINSNLSGVACWSSAIGELEQESELTAGGTRWGIQNYNNSSNENGRAAYINLYNSGSNVVHEWLLSPQIDLGTEGSFELKYDVSAIPWSGSTPVASMGDHFVKVVISTDGGLTWSDENILVTYDSDNIPAGGIAEVISLEGYSGIVQLGFYAYLQSTTPDIRFYIDNFEVVCGEVAIPEGEVTQNLEEGSIVADLDVEGNNVVWFGSEEDALLLINPISEDTILEEGIYYAVSVSGTCYSDPLEINVTLFLSNPEFDLESLDVYPNPVFDQLTVRYKDPIHSVKIYNLTGQLLYDQSYHTAEIVITVGYLVPGTYLVSIELGNQSIMTKVIKK